MIYSSSRVYVVRFLKGFTKPNISKCGITVEGLEKVSLLTNPLLLRVLNPNCLFN